MICDAQGVPLVVWTTPANVRDDTATPQGLLELAVQADAVPTLQQQTREAILMGDRGYGFAWLIELIRTIKWLPLLSPRGVQHPHGSGLGAVRYVVENPAQLAAYGLEKPACVLTLGLTGESGLEKSLLLGASAGEDGVYAMIRGEDVVFVVAEAMSSLLRRPLHAPAAPAPSPTG